MTWKPLETRPHHVSGARGDSGAGASHRTVQAWMDSREKQPGKGPQNPRTKRATTAGKSGATAGKKSIANCRQTTNNHHSYRGPPDTDHSTRWQRRQAKQHRGADGSDSAQRSEAQQSQFIEETIEISTEADWIQKIVAIPPLQCNDEKVEQWSSVFRRLRRCCRLNPLGKG